MNSAVICDSHTHKKQDDTLRVYSRTDEERKRRATGIVAAPIKQV